MSEVKYMNVWRNRDGSHQWTESFRLGAMSREMCDAVAGKFSDGKDGIYRMAVLRIRAKSEHAKD